MPRPSVLAGQLELGHSGGHFAIAVAHERERYNPRQRTRTSRCPRGMADSYRNSSGICHCSNRGSRGNNHRQLPCRKELRRPHSRSSAPSSRPCRKSRSSPRRFVCRRRCRKSRSFGRCSKRRIARRRLLVVLPDRYIPLPPLSCTSHLQGSTGLCM